jgi:hypothetical protein
MKTIVLNILLLSALSFYAQTQGSAREDFIKAYAKLWNKLTGMENYSFQLDYRSYKDHNEREPFETATGVYKKSGKNYMCNVLGIKTIQNSRMKITIDSAEKLIVLTAPQNISPAAMNLDQVRDLLDNAKSLTKKIVGKYTTYRIEFNKNELYQSMEYRFEAEGGLTQLSYYYAEQTDRDYNENGDMIDMRLMPRLDVCFSAYKQEKSGEGEFAESNIVVQQNNKLIASGKYRGYEVKDYRFK